MAKPGIAILLGGAKPKKMKEDKEQAGGEDNALVDSAGEEILAAIDAKDGAGLARTIAELCRTVKYEDED